MPVYGTIASQFNDKGTNSLFAALVQKINEKFNYNWKTSYERLAPKQKNKMSLFQMIAAIIYEKL